MDKLSVKDLDLKGKKVFVRADLNVPLENGRITDDTRIRAVVPTLKYILENGGMPVVASHLGRPKGQVKEEFRLTPVAPALEALLGVKVIKLDDCIGNEVKSAVDSQTAGTVIMLENLRFYKEEEGNDAGFAKSLSELADIYVNDAFGTSHRAHASTAGICQYLPSAAGLLVEKEIEFLAGAMASPERPFAAILGGAKVSGKLGVIENLLPKVDILVIGGGMTYTFWKAKGLPVGESLVEEDLVETAKTILAKAESLGKTIEFPVDFVVADRFAADAQTKVVAKDAIPDGWQSLDVGPETVKHFKSVLSKAKTIVWNGPLGVFEMDAFSNGTMQIARTLSELDAITIIGGGDSAAAVAKAGVEAGISHISTGGGASLELMEGKVLPGIAALNEKKVKEA